jgi:hypothetical protein
VLSRCTIVIDATWAASAHRFAFEPGNHLGRAAMNAGTERNLPGDAAGESSRSAPLQAALVTMVEAISSGTFSKAAFGAKSSFSSKPHVVMKQGMSNRQPHQPASPKIGFLQPERGTNHDRMYLRGRLALRAISNGGAPFRIKLRTRM